MESIRKEALQQIESIKDLKALEEVRLEFLSKKGKVASLMQTLKDLAPEARASFGSEINQLKEELTQAFDKKKETLEKELLDLKLSSEAIDLSLDDADILEGYLHPLSQVIEQVETFFIQMGFEIAEGPELESDHYNFEMMNLAKGHPARAMQDSFYVDPDKLLRTHTSPVQARTMLEKHGQPLAIICPGKVYRRDHDDPTHSHQFMQIEGLLVGKDVNFGQLKGVLLDLAKTLFGSDREIRLRPSYFPFTEPSVEVDVSYTKKDGTETFIEILGAGMVHPDVLQMAGYDPNQYRGFAFGIGVERIAILRYFIDDIRHFYTNDMRFLKQFKGE
jgi:phenylalanyl-tRNA synthetase alpha chain